MYTVNTALVTRTAASLVYIRAAERYYIAANEKVYDLKVATGW